MTPAQEEAIRKGAASFAIQFDERPSAFDMALMILSYDGLAHLGHGDVLAELRATAGSALKIEDFLRREGYA